MIKPILLSLSIVATLFSSTLMAETHKVDQKNMQFLYKGQPVQEIEIKVGDTITFSNSEEKSPHNVFAKKKGDFKGFNLKVQMPNTENSYTFDQEGEIEVRCLMHYKMKLLVKIKK